jgi:hypothetical protein
MGLAYARLTAQPGISPATKLANWRQSRETYQKSLDFWLEVKGRGALTLLETGEPDRIRNELAKCDAAPASLASSSQ